MSAESTKRRAPRNKGKKAARPPPAVSLPKPLSNNNFPISLPRELTEDDAEVCFICAEPIQYSAVTACNHRTCHICSLRIRALYKDHKCSYCKTESKEVLFTMPSMKSFSEYTADQIACKDEKLGISFETSTIMEETMILLRFNCPDSNCEVAANGWPDLKAHVKLEHSLFLCDLCVKNQKIFTHEHKLFTAKGLTSHYQHGDRDAQDNGFKGHPDCGFCKKAFYDDDELYRHCRDKHERCHVCDQLENGPGRAQYFQDYKKLDQHFRRDHFVCGEPACIEQKFVVFGSEIDLKAHQLEAHPHGLSGQALRDARKVQTAFAGYQPPPNARRNRPEMNLPADRPVQMTRDQLAASRHMEYLQARAQNSNFGFALTQDPKPAPSRDAFPALPQGPVEVKSTNQDVNKHQELLNRVRMIVGYDEDKIAIYKTNIAQFRSTNIPAHELIDNLWALFNVPIETLGSVITSTADLLDTRKTDLLAARNDWKLKNKPEPATTQSTSTSTWGSKDRILNIKNRASRNIDPMIQATQRMTIRQTPWSSSHAASSTGGPDFPSLPSSRPPRISTAQYFQPKATPAETEHEPRQRKPKKQILFTSGLQRG